MSATVSKLIAAVVGWAPNACKRWIHKVDRRPTFRIVVPTHRRPDLLARLLESLIPQLERHPEFCLVVVNDGSHDAAYQQVIDPHAARLTYIARPDPGGVGPARMLGYAGGREDYFVATDDDCLPPTDWLDRLLALATTYPEVDLFAGTTQAIDLPKGVIARHISAVPNAVPRPAVDRSWLVNAVTANAMYRRTVFEASGGFAGDMLGACEDVFVTQSIQRAGAVWMVPPRLVTGHRAVQSIGELIRKFWGYGVGAAQFAIREDDYRFAAMLKGRPTRLSCVRRSWAAMKIRWDAARRSGSSRTAASIQAVLTAMSRLAYEGGLWTGVRRFEPLYGKSFPSDWPLAERYGDFCLAIAESPAQDPASPADS